MNRIAKLLLCPLIAMMAVGVGCTSGDRTADGEWVPQEPDYADSTQWYVTARDGAADLFYIISTETGDYLLPNGTQAHFADTHSDSVRTSLHGEMLGVDTLLSGNLNFFSPYYRQCSLQSFADTATMARRLPVATDDVRRAFRYYLDNLNHGRPFILAGFSQGGMIMLELLREIDEFTRGRMIAAYAIGVTITPKMLQTNKNITPAQGADDLGVTVCYNSVRSPECAMHGSSAIGINPVNWCTDATPTALITEPSPLLPVAEQTKDTLTVHLDTTSGLTIVEGYTATDYRLPLFGKDGNYHTREIWLYRDCLRDNMALRSRLWLRRRALMGASTRHLLSH